MKNLKKIFDIGILFGFLWILGTVVYLAGSYYITPDNPDLYLKYGKSLVMLDIVLFVFSIIVKVAITYVVVLYVYTQILLYHNNHDKDGNKIDIETKP